MALMLIPFLLLGCGSGYKSVKSVQIQLAIYTPLCMEVAGGSTAEGAVVQTYPCLDNQPRQQWTLTPVDDKGNYNVVNLNSSQCMSVSNADPDLSTPIVQAPCYVPAISSQMWSLYPAPAPRIGYNLLSSLNKLCLDVPEGETVGETQLQVYTCTIGDPAQGYVFKSVN
ncbi:RICIN domain-containing protein [Granulicella arctica]|uniref:RICIN domain-containing protein n=1 Tax=Granulicella arctica TaxID=940613 RepID=UPI0021E0191D|nr:RICIN domain-containing protein [Granulicella arctica]